MTESLFLKKKEVHEAINYIHHVTNFRPQLALILGSGLGNFRDRINATSTVRSSEIPFYPVPTIQGHAGELIFGYVHNDTLHSMPLLVFQGRVHFYEMGSLEQVVFPIILSYQLGIKKLFITNAAGGINSCFHPGDLMLIQDILNLPGIQFPIAPNDPVLSKRKYSSYFDAQMKQSVIQCASQIKLPLQQGIYSWIRGPSYETPAEIRMLKRIGADAVGMSTVPEVFLARRLGMKIAGISLISNLAAGMSSVKLSHEDITEIGSKVTERFSELMEQLVLSLKQ